ncbi:hypothetical protein AVEN_42967-1 [Araneus ventricosus]|uniref:Uncharacterized protein n=1 Tax=Araneus ventricosus TaxID=182803 RepID=A0A4Y2AFB3_ARAVE|nr:hypothetical protein AVEN_42967-1 [Araneus ventricosus]
MMNTEWISVSSEIDDKWLASDISIFNQQRVKNGKYTSIFAQSKSTPVTLKDNMKMFLAGQHLSSDEEVQMTVTHWFRSQAAVFFDTDIQKLVSRYDTCFNRGGSYVET